MTLPFKKKKQETNASARVVDGKLVLSLPDAISPVVWQMDLTTVKASALEIIHDEARGAYALTLKTIKGENAEIAAFDNRTAALEGLMCASNALADAHGQIRNGESGGQNVVSAGPAKKTSTGRTILKILLGLLLLWIAFSIWAYSVPHSLTSGNGVANTASSTSAQSSSGVPVSADAFLSGQ